MKAQTFGISNTPPHYAVKNLNRLKHIDEFLIAPLTNSSTHEMTKDNFTTPYLMSAYNNYRTNRENGEAQDCPPGYLKFDGKTKWERQTDGYYHVKYTEGPNDKLWMEAKDRNYVFRLEREGRLDEREPNLQTEVPKLYEEVMAYRTTRAAEVKEQIMEKPKPM